VVSTKAVPPPGKRQVLATTRKLDLARLIDEDGTMVLFTVLEWNEAVIPPAVIQRAAGR
jgi:hypothetical protein